MAPKFSLQNVLDLRHGKVELLEIELGKQLSLRQATETLCLSLQERQLSLLERLQAAQSGEIDLFEMNLLRSEGLLVTQQLEKLALELARQNEAIKAKRAELIEARQSEETLEIIKKKRYEAYQAEQIQIEARAQDDIYIARAFRNQQPGA
jgi:flagellar biosynthesis chaperone FliJ